MSAPETGGDHELAGRFRRGLGLSLLNTLLSRLGTFAMGVLLARLLAPEEFGVYATALVVQLLLLTFNDMGSAAAVVRHQGEVRPILPTAWTVSVTGGLVAFLGCLIAAPALAAGLGSPEATNVIRLLAVNVLLDGFAAVPGALLTRELRQASRMVADLSGIALSLVLTPTLAFAGAGPWSLAIGHVAGTALVVVLVLVITRELPRFGFDRTHFVEVGRYGITVVGSSLLIVLSTAVPQLVTGSMLGGVALGFLYLASNVANWPVSIVSTTVERVALATFSLARDRGVNLDRAAAGVIGLVGVAVVPGGIALAVLADPIVEVIYGPAWAPAAHVLSGLAVAALARVLAGLSLHLLIAVGAPLSSVLIQLWWLLALVPSTLFAAHEWGLVGIGWAQAVVAVVIALPVHAWGLRRAGVGLAALMRGMALPALSGVVAMVGLCAVRWFVPSPLAAVLLGGAFTAVLVATGWYRSRHRVDDALNGGSRPAPVAISNEAT